LNPVAAAGKILWAIAEGRSTCGFYHLAHFQAL
jgi:hypothetical protein